MKDFLGQELAVGDFVLVGTPVNSGRGFALRKIVKFSPKMVQLESGYTWRTRPTSVYPQCVVKISPEQVTWYNLNHS
jgi:hypothetical protein